MSTAVTEKLTDEECYLLAILTDPSGLDLAEFCWYDPETHDAWRAWAFQWKWFRCTDTQQIDQCARAVGKSLSIKLRAFAFPFVHPGQEMVVTAPELVHLNPIIGLIERQFEDTRLGREMVVHGRSGITHRPFQMNFNNGSRIIGRIPQTTGKGVKGCLGEGTPVLTDKGFVLVEELKVGDRVLTHEGRYKPVEHIETDVNDCYEVRGQGSFPLVVSCDHRFYGAENQAGPKQKRDLLPLAFHDVEFLLEHNVYWATPTRFPELPVPHLPGLSDNAYFWWSVGRWLADGYLSRDKKNNKGRKVHWVVHGAKADAVEAALDRVGFKSRKVERSHSSALVIEVASAVLNRWLAEHFGEHADGKRLPAWLLGAPSFMRRMVLDGYLAGDGHENGPRKRWEVGSASKELATGVQLLAQSLGMAVNCSMVQPKPNAVCAAPKPSWRLQIGYFGHPVEVDGHLVAKVKSVKPVGKRRIYNPIIEDDHSYVSGAIVSHNIHPIWLEMDEAQDYPKDGWTELTETLQMGKPGAVWRAHGVTRGVQDEFYDHTKDEPNNPWKVHRITAMARPNWTDSEREKKIREYGGSRDAPDYRRNILGLHGDATNPLFVMHRFMRCVDSVEGSAYNVGEYEHFNIKAEMLEDRTGYAIEEQIRGILQMLDFSAAHKNYGGGAVTWVGMDVGFTADPSEILVFVEYEPTMKEAKNDQAAKRAIPEGGLTRLRLLTRITLQRIGSPLQVEVIKHVCDHYRPRAFGMDKTGNGLPLFQAVQASALPMARIIRGYNFSEKVIVDIDGTVTVGEGEDILKEAAIKSNVLEYSTDKLRELVDQGRLMLPFEGELIREFNGQTFTYSKNPIDQYGRRRRIFSQGHFHALDAARMASMAHAQHAIEEFIESQKQDNSEPVYDYFLTAGV